MPQMVQIIDLVAGSLCFFLRLLISKMSDELTIKPLLFLPNKYIYSRGGPHSALAPRPSLIYCALPNKYKSSV
jgi:hypothetical protein